MVLYDHGLQKFYNSPDIQNIIKTNRPLVFDKTKDLELTNNLISVISDGEVFTQKNENLVVTGFDFEDTKQEVTDSIKSVNALRRKTGKRDFRFFRQIILTLFCWIWGFRIWME